MAGTLELLAYDFFRILRAPLLAERRWLTPFWRCPLSGMPPGHCCSAYRQTLSLRCKCADDLRYTSAMASVCYSGR
ncbi:hypothetical protein EJU19_15205 [Salmonella enterica]|nr:hypothetical protein [Salmonella enterica]